MKKVILLVCLAISVCAFADNNKVSIEGIRYDIDFETKTAVVTDSMDSAPDGEPWSLYEGAIEIPKSFKYDGEKYKVTGIGEEAFWNSSVTSVIIPNSVTSIGDRAFSGSGDLACVTIPKSVTSIGADAFEYCGSLTSITIPNSVTTIEERAFQVCEALTSITIPKSVTSIGNGAFNGTGITTLVVDEKNLNYSSVDNVLFNKDKTELIYCPASIKGAYSIPNSVANIDEGAFMNCFELTSINIPESVTSIGNGAFQGCDTLSVINIPNSVTRIEDHTFSGCSCLTSIKIPTQVTSIGEGAFEVCTGLTSVDIPSSVTSIGSSAFHECSGLTSIIIPSSVTSIEYGTFYNCSALTSVTIPNSVTNIEKSAFEGCSTLTSITIPNTVTSIGQDAFRGCTSISKVDIDSNEIMSQDFTKSGSISSIFGKQVKEYVIGNNVKMIGDGAFRDCINLENVTIGNSVWTIGESAFAGCKRIDEISIPNSVTRIGDYAFDGCKSLNTVDVPSSVTRVGKFAFPSHVCKNPQPEIRSKFFDLTLGVSTKQEAISTLLSKNVELVHNSRNDLYARNVSIDGFQFESVSFMFSKGILKQIYFYDGGPGESKELSLSKYEKLDNYYTQKYDSSKYHCLEPEMCLFDDDVNKIVLTKTGISFCNDNISEQGSKAEAERYREIHPFTDTRIEKTILGCTLGTSTKKQVIDALSNLNINVLKDCYPDSVVFSAVNHEGVKFRALTAQFFAGRLSELMFTKDNELTSAEFNSLKSTFDARYSAYDRNNGFDDEGPEGKVSYFDDVVQVAIQQEPEMGLVAGGLFYQDCELTKQFGDYTMKSIRGQKKVSPEKQYIVDSLKKLSNDDN